MLRLVCCLAFMTCCALAYGADIEGKLTVLEKGGLAELPTHDNAVVYLSGIERVPPEKPVLSSQRQKEFEERVIVAMPGQEIQFWNNDIVRHNVFSADRRQTFDLDIYPKGEYKSVSYKEIGSYKVFCNIHPRMVCDIVVVPNSYYSLTAEDGRFKIKDVPQGRYTLHAWHIYGGMSKQEVVISNDDVSLDLEITSTQNLSEIRRHKNKHGKPYEKRSY